MRFINLPELKLLNERFYICEHHKLRHKSSAGGVIVGSEAGTLNKQGYMRFVLNGKKYNNHRAIYFMRTGEDPMGMEVDHINGDKLDNSPENHRLTSRKQNGRNRALNKNNKLRVKGVYWCKRDLVYKAFIRVDGVKINLGNHNQLESAKSAYKLAAKKYFGEFVRSEDNE